MSLSTLALFVMFNHCGVFLLGLFAFLQLPPVAPSSITWGQVGAILLHMSAFLILKANFHALGYSLPVFISLD